MGLAGFDFLNFSEDVQKIVWVALDVPELVVQTADKSQVSAVLALACKHSIKLGRNVITSL